MKNFAKTAFFKIIFLSAIFSLCSGCGVLSSEKDNSAKNGAFKDGVFISEKHAFSRAKKNNKNVLVVVAADDSDGEFSRDFIENIVKSPEFKTQIENKFIVLYMDFSENAYAKTLQNPGDKKRLQKEAQKFAEIARENSIFASKLAAQNTPAMFIFTKEQYFIAEIDAPQKIENFSTLKRLIGEQEEKIREINETVLSIKKGSSSEKLAAIDKLYERTDFARRAFLSDLIFTFIKLDKKNKSGSLSKYLLLGADVKSSEQFMRGNAESAVKSYVDICSNKYLLPQDRQTAYYLAAYIMIAADLKDYETCLNLMDLAIAAAPETDDAKTIKNFRDYLKNAVTAEQ